MSIANIAPSSLNIAPSLAKEKNVLEKMAKVILMTWRGCIGNVNGGLLPNAYLRHGHSQPVTKPRLLPDRQFFFTPTVLIIAPLFCIGLFKLFISGSIKRDDSKPYYPILGHTCLT